LLSDTLDVASSDIFQDVLQGGDSMSHPGHGDEPSLHESVESVLL